MRQEAPAFGHHLGEISKAELLSQIPAHAEHDDLLVKVPALEESVHFRVRSSALSFDRFANDYAVSKQFAPEPLVKGRIVAPVDPRPPLEMKSRSRRGHSRETYRTIWRGIS